jgi:hypothetical protein
MNGCQPLSCCMLWNIAGGDSDDNFAKTRKNHRYIYFRTTFVSGSRKLEEVHWVLEIISYVRADSVTYHICQIFPEVLI